MSTKHRLQLVIYLSSLLLAAGLFLPLTSFPVYGEVSYYRIAQIESWLIIGFALGTPALILAGKEKWGILTVFCVWGVLLYPKAREIHEASSRTVLRRLGNELSSAMVEFSADFFLNIARFHWGGLMLVFALLAFTLSSIYYRWKFA